MIWTQKTFFNGTTWAHIMRDEPECETHAWQTLNFSSRQAREDCIENCSKCGALRTTPPVALGYG